MLEVQTEFTPNPNSLKFNLNQQLLQSGTLFVEKKEDAGEVATFVEELFAIEKVESVLLGSSFVTVTRAEGTETWGTIIQGVTKTLEAYFETNPQPIAVAGAGQHAGGNHTDVEKKIIQILDQQIRPAIARDGGDIVFHGFKDGVLTLHLQGACSTCPSSVATLKQGVERMLKEYVPEVQEVVQLN